jgi:ribose-phosphate pyrophosphokinase
MISLNSHVIEPTIFPDKTSQVWNIPTFFLQTPKHIHRIRWVFEEEAELIHLHQLVLLLKEQMLPIPIHLEMSYLPYARQDKPIDNYAAFAFHSFCKIINSMGIDIITVLDPHCSLHYAINNVRAISPIHHMTDALDEFEPDYFCFPDDSARHRYLTEVSILQSEFGVPESLSQIIEFKKIRDPSSGMIVSYEIKQNGFKIEMEENAKKRVLIIDDICDGGSTFILCASKLRELGFEEIGLYVTHGLFTKGYEALKEAGIKAFYSKEGRHDV